MSLAFLKSPFSTLISPQHLSNEPNPSSNIREAMPNNCSSDRLKWEKSSSMEDFLIDILVGGSIASERWSGQGKVGLGLTLMKAMSGCPKKLPSRSLSLNMTTQQASLMSLGINKLIMISSVSPGCKTAESFWLFMSAMGCEQTSTSERTPLGQSTLAWFWIVHFSSHWVPASASRQSSGQPRITAYYWLSLGTIFFWKKFLKEESSY